MGMMRRTEGPTSCGAGSGFGDQQLCKGAGHDSRGFRHGHRVGSNSVQRRGVQVEGGRHSLPYRQQWRCDGRVVAEPPTVIRGGWVDAEVMPHRRLAVSREVG